MTDPHAVPWEELLDAFIFVNSAPQGENLAILHRSTGQIDCDSVWTEIWDQPADGKTAEKKAGDETLTIPHKTDLGLGRDLVLWFVEEIIPDRYEDVADFFQKRGAYAKFKALLTEEGLVQEWYRFEKEAEEQA